MHSRQVEVGNIERLDAARAHRIVAGHQRIERRPRLAAIVDGVAAAGRE
jgi:hypothetical protein